MPNFEKIPEQNDIQKKRDEISLQASQMPEFQEAVKEAEGKIDAIKAVRILLDKKFSQISEIPDEEQKEPKKIGGPKSPRVKNLSSLFGKVSNNLKIAKDIVDLLWEND